MKTILISGGSEGLGRAIAKNLAQNNDVIILARDETKLQAVADELGCRYIVGDVRDYAAMQQAGVSLEGAELYGGVAYGLVGRPDKRVDDVDLLLKVDSAELYAGAQELQSAFEWSDIDPQSILSERRRLLKAKRWSTSQIRIFDPEFLSIDLKVGRDSDQPSLWEELPDSDSKQFEGRLHVIDDSEAYCISPAVRCEDEKGSERIVLFRGYPYIGCAVAGDTIKVRGRTFEDSQVVLVTQAAEDLLVPDFSKVPIS